MTLLYFDDCPNWQETDAHLRTLQTEFPGLRVTRHLVGTTEEAERIGFAGSPSILVDGVDPFAGTGSHGGLSCRRYETPDGVAGSPTLDQLRAVLEDTAIR